MGIDTIDPWDRIDSIVIDYTQHAIDFRQRSQCKSMEKKESLFKVNGAEITAYPHGKE